MARTASAPPYGTVVFDCDSTLSSIEGIDELVDALSSETAERMRALTERAMSGELALQDVYGARLKVVRPSAAELLRVAERYVATALPHARELVAALHDLGKRVEVVSGGILQPVQHLAAWLGIDASHVHAVAVRFDDQGAYAGFDEASPLARAGGKPEVLRALRRAHPDDSRLERVALVGDGATDLEAAPECARFVAFAGVAARPAVLAGADAVCHAADLAGLLPLLVSDAECERLSTDPAHRPLLEAAAALA